MNKYIIYKKEDGSFVQIITCTEDEIQNMGKPYIKVGDAFELEVDVTYKVEDGVLVKYPFHGKSHTMEVLNNEYSVKVKELLVGIPDIEISTFPAQYEEARRWISDNTSYTPFIDALLIARTDHTKETLVAKIIEKADAYAVAIGNLTGLRQAKEKEILGE